jgi:hypothetical protein
MLARRLALIATFISAAFLAHAGALEGLPSQPAGEHLARIQALGDNAWVDLGMPAADPKWGTPPGRSYSSKMAYAPELRGAFLTGGGVHGAVKKDGHYTDDVWFYDINARRWICLYPGADVRNLKLKLDEHGFYDAALNVHFIYVARDGSDKGTMWAYRCRRAAAPEVKP